MREQEKRAGERKQSDSKNGVGGLFGQGTTNCQPVFALFCLYCPPDWFSRAEVVQILQA